jgi:probable rRNA maturation factor
LPPAAYRVSIRGLKRELGVDRTRLRRTLAGALAAERAPEGGELSVALVGDRTMRRLNRDYRGIDRTTDVLSFSYLDEPHSGGVLGEIYVSPTVAERQAAEAGCPTAEEIARLALHGLLHVLGWMHDTARDRRRMIGRQERYLEKFWRSPVPCH